MPSHETISVSKGVTLLADSGMCEIQAPAQCFRLTGLSPSLQDAMKCLFQGRSSERELLDMAASTQGLSAVPQFSYILDRLSASRLLCRTVSDENGSLATFIPNGVRRTARSFEQSDSFVLSRFALMRRAEDRMVLESPLGTATAVLLDARAVAVVSVFSKPRSMADLPALVRGTSIDACAVLLRHLCEAKLVGAAPLNGVSLEDSDPRLVTWQFHDFLMHTRSRFGRHSGGYGGTYRFKSDIKPPPAVKERMSRDVVVLPRPDLASITGRDASLVECMERRRSITEQGALPIKLSELGEFLFRVAREREVYATENGEVSNRPYPSGGASYELEIYPCISQCQGAEPGLYQYRPREHELCRVCASNPNTDLLLDFACHAANSEQRPQVLLIITARFPRVMWKYESVAYSLILKHVGVLYQSMYLVATAMRLAPRALGGGDSDLFAHTAGLDGLSESSVGEFMLNSFPSST
jgi:SagB-type dehydrogenase family enzyme